MAGIGLTARLKNLEEMPSGLLCYGEGQVYSATAENLKTVTA